MSKNGINLKILLFIMVLLISTGVSCKCVSTDVRKQLKPITLEFWSTWDDSKVFVGLIEKYKEFHPNISINYRKLRYEEYEKMLLDAWVEGRGPDIFSIHNTWVPKYKTKIFPLPKKISMPYVSYQPPLPGCKRKTEEIIETKTIYSPTLADIKDNYVATVFADVILKDAKGVNQIYALPLSLDTLTLFYNRNLLDSANIPFPPADWDEFIEDVRLLTRLDIDKKIIQSGTAMGTFDNVDRAFDIISLLIMQNGGNLYNFGDSRTLEALNFYLDFASPDSEIYTWNNKMPNSLDAFMEGKLAFFFGYSYYIPIIKAKSPTLNFAVSNIPQVDLSHPINYANYWVQTVFKNSKHPKEAWDFLLFLNKEENIKQYLKQTGKPTALRNLVKDQESNSQIKPFVSQVLSADSWHNITNFNYVEESFKEMFEKFYIKGPNEEKSREEKLKILVGLVNKKIQRAR